MREKFSPLSALHLSIQREAAASTLPSVCVCVRVCVLFSVLYFLEGSMRGSNLSHSRKVEADVQLLASFYRKKYFLFGLLLYNRNSKRKSQLS